MAPVPKKLLKKNFVSFVLFKTIYLGSYWSDLDKKKYGRRGRNEGFPMIPFSNGPYWSELDEKNMGRVRRELSNDPGTVHLGTIVSEKKIFNKNFPSFVLFKSLYLGCYWSNPDEKNMRVGAGKELFNDPSPVLLGVIVSEKKITDLDEKNIVESATRTSSDPGRILQSAIVLERAPRGLSNDPGPALLDAVVSEKKIKNFFSYVLFKPLYLGYYWSGLEEKNMVIEGATRAFQ
ncbi:LOW QUALITY PROTEIN: hypothetical protein V1477_006654 [Vespula maculifrons]|uniref:Uncharacterized protein n=1 Tax=Vespula maculifrons TaxID=7453 RepID=A0ABD2CJG9_VESMC